MFNAQQRIRQLMDERGWTIYRLAQERSKTGDDALRKSKYAIYGK